jgi:hypothetical protein
MDVAEPVSEQNDHQPEAIDFAAVARVSNRIALTQIRFASAQADSFAEPEEVDGNWGESAFLGYRTTFWRKDPETLEVRVSFLAFYQGGKDISLGPPPEFTQENAPDVVFECTLVLAYGVRGEDPLEDNDVEQFAQVNSPMHAWPYWREFAQSSSARLGIPNLVIGVYKLPSVYDPGVDREA